MSAPPELPRPLPYLPPSPGAGIDLSRPVAVAAVAASLPVLLRFAVTVMIWRRSGMLYARHWANVLVWCAALAEGLAGPMILVGGVALLAARLWGRPVLLLGLACWVASMAVGLVLFFFRLNQVVPRGTDPIFIASNAAQLVGQFILPLLLGWLVMRLPRRLSA